MRVPVVVLSSLLLEKDSLPVRDVTTAIEGVLLLALKTGGGDSVARLWTVGTGHNAQGWGRPFRGE